MSTAKELCEKVLANGIISRSGKANAENAHAAPRLAKMLLKAVEQRDEYLYEAVELNGGDCNEADKRASECNAELDQIAKGDG